MSEGMNDATFSVFRDFIETNLGIRLPPAKKVMLEARLGKRLRVLGFSSYEEYSEYVFGSEGFDREIQQLIDSVTTNETSFFREPAHFGILSERVYPELAASGSLDINIWSVAASTGQEAYTLAMVTEEYSRVNRVPVSYRILGTDISEKVLQVAHTGIYTEHQAERIPLAYKRLYCRRSRDPHAKTVRISPEIRARTMFRQLNLMDESYPVTRKYAVVFCRNVFIYFDRENQKKVLERIYDHMVPGGYLFMGHSENIAGVALPFKAVASAVYRRE